MKDFTLKSYKTLLVKILSNNWKAVTLENYEESFSLTTIIRHDVDRKPQNALRMAKLENELGIKSTYYFRIISQTFKPEIIKKIADLGHEIGYHYECLAETNGDYEKAIDDFGRNLEKLRGIVPVKNIAMHGRPTSKWDSRLLWKKYDYKKYGILSEPYFDIDFNNVLYITDAGRSWDNENINLRDKVESKFNFSFSNTKDIIQALDQDKLPEKIMLNIHPEHWANSNVEWWKIWAIRKVKNSIKKVIIGI